MKQSGFDRKKLLGSRR